MHPEIEQDHPGDCPKCGMALEPKRVTADTDDEENAELLDMTRRLWMGAALTVPVFVLAMAHMIPAPAVPVVVWAGWPFFRRGWRSVITRHLKCSR